MLKSFKYKVFDAIGVTALKAQLQRIEDSANSIENRLSSIQSSTITMNRVQAERELRAAGWSAAITNRQIELEQAVLDFEVSLRRIGEKIDSGLAKDDMRFQELSLELYRLRQSVSQVRDRGEEPN